MSVYLGNPSYAIEPSDRAYYHWLDQADRRDACVEAFVRGALDDLAHAAGLDIRPVIALQLIQETMENVFDALFSSIEKHHAFSILLLKIWRKHRQDQEEDSPELKLARLLETEITAYTTQQAKAKY